MTTSFSSITSIRDPESFWTFATGRLGDEKELKVDKIKEEIRLESPPRRRRGSLIQKAVARPRSCKIESMTFFQGQFLVIPADEKSKKDAAQNLTEQVKTYVESIRSFLCENLPRVSEDDEGTSFEFAVRESKDKPPSLRLKKITYASRPGEAENPKKTPSIAWQPDTFLIGNYVLKKTFADMGISMHFDDSSLKITLRSKMHHFYKEVLKIPDRKDLDAETDYTQAIRYLSKKPSEKKSKIMRLLQANPEAANDANLLATRLTGQHLKCYETAKKIFPNLK